VVEQPGLDMHDINRALGRLEGQFEALTRQIADLTKMLSEAGAISTTRDKDVTKLLQDIDDRLQAVEKTMRDLEPMVHEVHNWREKWTERGRGALMFWGFVSSIAGATIATFWAKIVAAITGNGQ
jgi:prefoldin subunit 5